MDFNIYTSDATFKVHLMFSIVGGFILIFSLFSLFIKERLFLSEAFVSVLLGIIVGPYVLNFLDPKDWFGHPMGTFTFEFSRIVMAIQVMAAGVSLPRYF